MEGIVLYHKIMLLLTNWIKSSLGWNEESKKLCVKENKKQLKSSGSNSSNRNQLIIFINIINYVEKFRIIIAIITKQPFKIEEPFSSPNLRTKHTPKTTEKKEKKSPLLILHSNSRILPFSIFQFCFPLSLSLSISFVWCRREIYRPSSLVLLLPATTTESGCH